MGYTTEFVGKFDVTPHLSKETVKLIKEFSDARHGGPAKPFSGFPGFWCDWVATPDGKHIMWNGNEKFYDYVDWLDVIIDRFIKPAGSVLEGTVFYQGETDYDSGTITVHKNEVIVSSGPAIHSSRWRQNKIAF